MNEREIRAKIRELMTAGVLPQVMPDGSLVDEAGCAVAAEVHVGRIGRASCAICGGAEPEISYAYPARKILRFHTYCDVLWQEERAR